MSEHGPDRRRGYRAARLAHAIAEALEGHLLPSFENESLQNLHVLNVEVSSNLSSAHVTLAPAAQTEANEQIHAALAAAEPRLRGELAGILRIKRMPTLRLSYIPLPLWPKTEGQGGGTC